MILVFLTGSTAAQNKIPYFNPINDTIIAEQGSIVWTVIANDSDAASTLTLWADGVPDNATFDTVAGGLGVGTFQFHPSIYQAGQYTVTFFAHDGIDTAFMPIVITVTNVNIAPVLALIADTNVVEGNTLTFPVSATDPDETTPVLSALAYTVPPNASFVDNNNGTGAFTFTPDFTQSRTYTVMFVASDGDLADSQAVNITVIDAGNRPPVITDIGPKSIAEGAELVLTIVATDPDNDSLTLTAEGLPTNAFFTDNRNKTGRFAFAPDTSQAGLYNVTFIASDTANHADTMVLAIEVTNNAAAPILDPIGPKEVTEGQRLLFTVHAVDSDGPAPMMDILNLPDNAVLIDSGNGTATFDFSPSYTQSGSYFVTFIATDGFFADSEVVSLTVLETGNQPPIIDSIGPQTVFQGGTVSFTITATDADGPTPTVAVIPTTLPANATYVDSIGLFTFTPSCRQGGTYTVIFFASDSLIADTEMVPIMVIDSGNWLPSMTLSGPTTISEGRRLETIIRAVDCEGPIDTIWVLPPLDDTLFHGNLRLDRLDDSTARLEFFPDYSQAKSYLLHVYASDGKNTVSKELSVTVTNVDSSLIDPGARDTLRLIGRDWIPDLDSSFFVPIVIANDYPVAGAITGFRWFDPDLECDSVVLDPVFDQAFYTFIAIYPDSMKFDAEFIFYDSLYFPPPGGHYLTAYFSYHGIWDPASILLFDTTKIGSNGYFVFDKRLKGRPPLTAAEARSLLRGSGTIYTYAPLLFIGDIRYPVAAEEPTEPIPNEFSLEQNYPNPFNPETIIRFRLSRQSYVTLKVYNILGQQMTTLADGEYGAGEHRLTWNGRDNSGRPAASGIYLYQIRAEGHVLARKMVLLR